MNDNILTQAEHWELDVSIDLINKLPPPRDIEDPDDLYPRIQHDMLRLSLLLRDKPYAKKSIPFAEDVMLYCMAEEYMEQRTFPDGKTIDDLFPGVRERFDALKLTPWQCYEVIRTYNHINGTMRRRGKI